MEGGAFQDGDVEREIARWVAIHVDLQEGGVPSDLLACKQTQYIPELTVVDGDGDVRATENFMEADALVRFLSENR